MRKAFVDAMLNHVTPQESVFLTGDLGFMALEPLRDRMGERFVNAGIAEQNMVSTAAGLAHTGLSAWVYSIAPFCYARPFEQIRNDICLHRLPVHLVGNGGGYGYGVMGSTHHALEDYGVLLTLPGMRAFVPAFAADLDALVQKIQHSDYPSYLRLGRCELPAGFSVFPYAPWRRLTQGEGPVVLCVGPLAGGILKTLMDLDGSIRPEFWVLTELPFDSETIPTEFYAAVKRAGALWVVEEHVAQGSLGYMVASWVLQQSPRPAEFRHFHARGYPSRKFGSQAFHRQESGIDAATILDAVLMREQPLRRT